MSIVAIADLTKDAERAFGPAFRGELAVASCETFEESHYRGGFRLRLAGTTGSCEVLYSDMQLEVRFNGREVFGNNVHAGFEGNMFSREHLREYLPRIAASAAAGAQAGNVHG
ncbi:hypothetical protein ACV4V4_22070 [Pseudomonas aeruginosa]|nr:hypothetical protein [Pseudomonas aeruginosa]EKB4879796.1 hypothetical protein [Pseudomonas aeruginosa]EKE7664733.1 hypothetical protein [Pseudomonas aeruginosa]EKE7664952.1 hypothetical protein [Pseudomonas aeruginosa]HCA5812088.1 hypothetical protein [Pseudomonas aeruginosa]